jgi:DNA-binding NarL/FixJ family response regulator
METTETSHAADVTTKSRVFLVEDHPVVRHGLTTLIDDEPDLAVCGGAESMKEALAQIRKLKPDVAVIDITLGDGSGLDLIKQVHEERPKMPLLALSMHDESVYAERALRAGAKGYIMKKEAMDKVMTAIRKVLAGELYVSEKMSARMVQKLVNPQSAGTTPTELLSDREFEVFRLIAQGIGPSEIASRLAVSVKTIETHREHIKEKLGLKTGVDLTRYCLQWAMTN